MTKVRFLLSLHDKLGGLPQDEAEERLNFYSEMIEDRMEEGLSEEEAVAAVGSVEDIASQIIADVPFAAIVKEKMLPKKRYTALEIALLILGSPVWFSLLVAALAVVFSLCISLWAVILSLWSVFVSVIACALCGTVGGVVFSAGGNGFSGVAMIGAGLVCAGLSVLTFFGCKAATKGTAFLTHKAAVAIKKALIKRGERNE